MNQDDLACGGWIAAFIAVLVCMVIILCGGECISTDASIPASVIP